MRWTKMEIAHLKIRRVMQAHTFTHTHRPSPSPTRVSLSFLLTPGHGLSNLHGGHAHIAEKPRFVSPGSIRLGVEHAKCVYVCVCVVCTCV